MLFNHNYKYKHSAKGRLTEQKYNRSGSKKATNKRWNLENKHKRKAHYLVEKALKNGWIIKKDCIICNDQKSEGHHFDYSLPLEVVWLCSVHHGQLHSKRLVLLNN